MISSRYLTTTTTTRGEAKKGSRQIYKIEKRKIISLHILVFLSEFLEEFWVIFFFLQPAPLNQPGSH